MSRHSSFSRKSAPRPWRSSSKSTDPQASLSLVFAEPEQSVSSGAAATLSSTQQTDDAGRNVEPSLHTPDQRDAASSLRRASYASLRSLSKRARRDSAAPNHSEVNQQVPAAHAHGEDPTMTTSSPESVDVNLPSIPRPSNHPGASRQSVQPAGWFSSLGRKSRMVSLEPEQETIQPVDKVSQSPETSRTNGSSQVVIQPPTPESTAFESTPSTTVGIPFPASSEPEPIPLTAADEQPKSQGVSWFSGKAVIPMIFSTKDQTNNDPQSSIEALQAPLPTNLIARGPTPPQDIPRSEKAGAEPSTQAFSPPAVDGSVPSSVDDSVPIVSSFSPPASPIPVSVRPRERTLSNLSSLNPSSSRFILSTPLLGRTKVPLDQIVAQVEQARGTSELSGSVKRSIQPEGKKCKSPLPKCTLFIYHCHSR